MNELSERTMFPSSTIPVFETLEEQHACEARVKEEIRFKEEEKHNTNRMNSNELLAKIPEMAQRQDSVTEQINDLLDVATRLGMYDARDWVRENFYSRPNKDVIFGYDKSKGKR